MCIRDIGVRPIKRKGKHPVSRRYNLLPLLPSGPGGVQRELAVRDLPFWALNEAKRAWVPAQLSPAGSISSVSR